MAYTFLCLHNQRGNYMTLTAKELFLALLPESADLNEEKVSALLLRAENTILDITGRATVPEQLIDVQAQLALIFYNRLGTEGENRRSEGEIVSDYINGLPNDIMLRLKNYPRKVGVMGAVGSEQTQKG